VAVCASDVDLRRLWARNDGSGIFWRKVTDAECLGEIVPRAARNDSEAAAAPSLEDRTSDPRA